MKVDWDKIESAAGREPVPAGTYLCELENVDTTRRTRAGDEMWGLRFTVLDGEHKGRVLFDDLFFAEKALPRVKFVCKQLGVALAGTTALDPDDLIGRRAYVTAQVETYEGRERNKVPYRGYAPISADATQPQEQKAEDDPGKVPF